MSDKPRVSRSVAFFDLDHGILREGASKFIPPAVRWMETLAGPFARVNLNLERTAVEDVRLAGRNAAGSVALAPYAPKIIDEHRDANRRLVATTQTPLEYAEPIAEALGFDDIIATKLGVSDEDEYDGTVQGPVIYGRGKLQALREWAPANGASLKRSYFYGGSFADASVLAEVGRPVAIDPDPRLAALAWLKGWPTRSLYAPPGVARTPLGELQELGRAFTRPELVPNARFEFRDLEHIPSEGPAIVCGNHRSYFDSVAVGLAITQRGRTARFLGKKEVFDAPIVGMLARWAGGIRVERGTGSDEPLHEAAAALEAGDVIMLMPEGTIPRGPAFFEPELKGRWGAARLAAMTKAPVIPLGLWGTEKVWPRSSRFPNLNPLNRPLVTVTAGPPVPLTYGDPDTDTKAIMSAIVDLLPEEARIKRDPTLEELERTYPAGYKGDPSKELERRPGTDA